MGSILVHRGFSFRYLMVLLALFLLFPLIVPSPRAQIGTPVGTVCIASASSTLCPPVPVVVTGELGNKIQVAVSVQNSSSFNEVDIMVKADPSIVNATGFDLSASVLSSPAISTACVNGHLIGGTIACSPQDGPGVAHLTVAAGCAGVTLFCGFGGGNLFNINYTVVGTTLSSPIDFQTGCYGGGPNPTPCVTIQFVPANILCCPPPDFENLQTGTFVTGPSVGNGVPVSTTVSFDGLTGTITGNILVNSTARTLLGTLSVTVVNSTSGQTTFSKTYPIVATYVGTNTVFVFVLAIPVTPFTLGAIGSVDSVSNKASFVLMRDPDFTHAGFVNILDALDVFFEFGWTPSSPGFLPQADLNGNGIIDINDATTVSYCFNAPVFP